MPSQTRWIRREPAIGATRDHTSRLVRSSRSCPQQRRPAKIEAATPLQAVARPVVGSANALGSMACTSMHHSPAEPAPTSSLLAPYIQEQVVAVVVWRQNTEHICIHGYALLDAELRVCLRGGPHSTKQTRAPRCDGTPTACGLTVIVKPCQLSAWRWIHQADHNHVALQAHRTGADTPVHVADTSSPLRQHHIAALSFDLGALPTTLALTAHRPISQHGRRRHPPPRQGGVRTCARASTVIATAAVLLGSLGAPRAAYHSSKSTWRPTHARNQGRHGRESRRSTP